MAEGSRRSGEMQQTGPSTPTDHSTHDLLLLSAAADRASDPAVRRAADAQAAGCAECASLLGDLKAVAAGLAALPAARPVPRDMRLSPADATRLRRGSLWRRLLAPFGPGGLPALRPLAAALTTLGLAGILLTALPLGLGGAVTLDTIGRSVGGVPGLAPAPSAGSAEGYKDLASSAPQHSEASPVPAATPTAAPAFAADQTDGQQATNAAAGGRPSTLTVLSIVLAAAGLGLFGLLLVARRLA